MGAIRRFSSYDEDNSIFRFTIDTRFVKIGNTDGSEKDKQFILPFFNGGTPSNFILKVSDGRPDVSITSANLNTYKTLIFATAGIYQITCIGKGLVFFYNASPDQWKITKVLEFGIGFSFRTYGFQDAVNLIWDAPFARMNTLDRIFLNIKGIGPNCDFSKYLVDTATSAGYLFSGIQSPLPNAFSGFFSELTNATDFYRSTDLGTISEIQIIAPKLINASQVFYASNFRGRIVVKSEVLTNITGFIRNTANPPSLGEVDIRRVTSSSLFITGAMALINVDATLLGWVNNFDWTVIPTVTNKTTYDFYNSKYSNNPAVIVAKSFLESKGILFTRLTMA